MKQIAISNYENSTLNIYNIPDNIVQSEEYEKWITEILGYKLSNIEWFIFKEIVEAYDEYEGNCPNCSKDENLEAGNGSGFGEYDYECLDCGHNFTIESKGWRIL